MIEFKRLKYSDEHADDPNADLSEHSTAAWSKLFPYDIYKSDLVLRVDHVLTEPACPTATLVHEVSGITLYRADAETIDEAIEAVVKKFVNAAQAGELPSLEEIRHRDELQRDRKRRYVKSEEQSIREFNQMFEGTSAPKGTE